MNLIIDISDRSNSEIATYIRSINIPPKIKNNFSDFLFRTIFRSPARKSYEHHWSVIENFSEILDDPPRDKIKLDFRERYLDLAFTIRSKYDKEKNFYEKELQKITFGTPDYDDLLFNIRATNRISLDELDDGEFTDFVMLVGLLELLSLEYPPLGKPEIEYLSCIMDELPEKLQVLVIRRFLLHLPLKQINLIFEGSTLELLDVLPFILGSTGHLALSPDQLGHINSVRKLLVRWDFLDLYSKPPTKYTYAYTTEVCIALVKLYGLVLPAFEIHIEDIVTSINQPRLLYHFLKIHEIPMNIQETFLVSFKKRYNLICQYSAEQTSQLLELLLGKFDSAWLRATYFTLQCQKYIYITLEPMTVYRTLELLFNKVLNEYIPFQDEFSKVYHLITGQIREILVGGSLSLVKHHFPNKTEIFESFIRIMG